MFTIPCDIVWPNKPNIYKLAWSRMWYDQQICSMLIHSLKNFQAKDKFLHLKPSYKPWSYKK